MDFEKKRNGSSTEIIVHTTCKTDPWMVESLELSRQTSFEDHPLTTKFQLELSLLQGLAYGRQLTFQRPAMTQGAWLVGCGLSTVSAVDQVLTETLTLFQAARERRCHVQRPGIKPGWLNLEARNLPLDPECSPNPGSWPWVPDKKADVYHHVSLLPYPSSQNWSIGWSWASAISSETGPIANQTSHTAPISLALLVVYPGVSKAGARQYTRYIKTLKTLAVYTGVSPCGVCFDCLMCAKCVFPVFLYTLRISKLQPKPARCRRVSFY